MNSSHALKIPLLEETHSGSWILGLVNAGDEAAGLAAIGSVFFTEVIAQGDLFDVDAIEERSGRGNADNEK